MMKYSVTYAGIFVAFLTPVFLNFGFDESCSSQLANVLAPVPGLLIAAYGRWRHNDVTPLGLKKLKGKK